MSDNCELPRHHSTSDELRNILTRHRVVAVVGLSTDTSKPSYHVAEYLQRVGYTIVPIHPKAASILGEKTYANLREVPASVGVEIVDIFRRPDAVMEHVEEAIAVGAKVVWMQEGVINNAAADRAKAAGLQVVMNLCMLKEHRAL
jgi:predicted CoA-binding protein